MGPSLSWYRDGSLMLLEEYEENQLVKGQYYKKNALDSVSSVINGSGIASLYDENGVFLRKIPYVEGEPVDPED
jgi:antitoxin component YwqK of YwqJK toxin-antitoxin module